MENYPWYETAQRNDPSAWISRGLQFPGIGAPLGGKANASAAQYGQGNYSQSGQTYNTPQWASTMQGMTSYSPSGQVQGAGTYGLPASLPTDQTFMQNYGWPASLQGQGAVFNQQAAAQNAANQMALAKMQPQLAGETTAANMAERGKVAEKMGFNAPSDASSMLAQIKKGFGSAVQTQQTSAARSGMPISSVTENAKSASQQTAIEAWVRAFAEAQRAKEANLMGFMK